MNPPTAAASAWRPATIHDAPAIVRLDHATLEADGRDDPLSLDEVLEEFEPSWALPEERSVVAVAPTGELHALAWIHLRPGSHRARTTFVVHPDARAGDVPRRLLAEVFDRVRGLDGTGAFADAGVVEIEAQPHQEHRVALLEEAGFRPQRRFHELRRDLTATIARPEPPTGTRIARWDTRWSEPARLAHVEAFADHWGSTPPDRERWQHDFLHGKFRPDLSFVAVTEDGEVAGYLLAHVFEQDWKVRGYRDAWIGTLGTRRAWRGRGVASALMLRSMHRMRDVGMEYAAIAVDSQSQTGADRLYAQHGFELQRVHVNYALPVAELR